MISKNLQNIMKNISFWNLTNARMSSKKLIDKNTNMIKSISF